MSTAPHTPPAPPRGSDGFFDSLRRSGIWRTPDRWIGGVAAGTAHRLGVDPVLVRGGFVVLTFLGGLGLVLYGLGWALLPESVDGRIHLQEAVRGRFDAALAGAIAFFLVGVSRPGFWWDWPGSGIGAWVALAAVVAIVAVVVSNRSDSPPPAPPGPRPAESTYPMNTTPAPGTTTAPLPDPSETVVADDDATRPLGTTSSEDTAGTRPFAGASAYDQSAYAPTGGGAWSGGPTGPGGAVPPPPPVPAPPAVPPPPPVPGPGSRLVSSVLALCLLVVAAFLVAHRTGALEGNLFLLAGGTVLAILGVGIFAAGLRGRRQGAFGGLAIVLAVVLVPTAGAVSAFPGLGHIGNPGTILAGDPVFRPTTGTQAREGAALGAGELTVDLTDLGPTREVVEVPVEVGMGVARVIVPDNAEVEVRAQVGGGEVLARVDSDWTTPVGSLRAGPDSVANGMGIDVLLSQEGESNVRLVVDVEVGFGQIVIEERS